MNNRDRLNLQERAALLTAPDVVPLTTEQVAQATGIAPATLRKWACRGGSENLLPYAKRAGRNLYRASDVRAWLGGLVVESPPFGNAPEGSHE